VRNLQEVTSSFPVWSRVTARTPLPRVAQVVELSPLSVAPDQEDLRPPLLPQQRLLARATASPAARSLRPIFLLALLRPCGNHNPEAAGLMPKDDVPAIAAQRNGAATRLGRSSGPRTVLGCSEDVRGPSRGSEGASKAAMLCESIWHIADGGNRMRRGAT
jgi:hypothetical protein